MRRRFRVRVRVRRVRDAKIRHGKRNNRCAGMSRIGLGVSATRGEKPQRLRLGLGLGLGIGNSGRKTTEPPRPPPGSQRAPEESAEE